MPLIQPDTSEALDQGPIDPGTYKAKIVEAVPGVSKGKGNPIVTTKFHVDVEGKTRTRTAWLVTSGEASFQFDQLLRCTGFEAQADAFKAKGGDKPPFDTDWLVGQEVNVVIAADEYQGQLRDKIQSFLKA